MSIQEYLSILKRNWFLVLMCSIAALGVSFYYTARKVDLFSSGAKVLVNQPRSYILLQSGPGDLPDVINLQTQKSLLRSPAVATQVRAYLKQMVADRGYNPKVHGKKREYHLEDVIPPEAPLLNQPLPSAYQLMNMVGVGEVQDTNILTINTLSSDRYATSVIANLFADAFLKRSSQLTRDKTVALRDYLEDQRDKVKKLLDDQEKQLLAFKVKAGILNVESFEERHQMRLEELTDKQAELEQGLLTVRQEVAGLQGRVQGEEMKALVDFQGLSSENLLGRLQEAIFEAQTQRDELLRQFTVDHPDVEAANMRIAQLRRQFEDTVQSHVQGQGLDLQDLSLQKGRLQAAMTKEAELEDQLAAINNQLKNHVARYDLVVEDWKEIQRLLRQKSITEQRYVAVVKALEEVELREIKTENIGIVVERARVPGGPINDTAKRDYLMALLFGLLLGFAIAYFKEESRELIRSTEDIKRHLGLPVLGTIPHQTGMSGRLVSEIPVKSPFAESFKQLAYMLELASIRPEHPLKTFAVTSAKVSEGKTSVMANLGITISQLGDRVVIVDTDMRRPMLHRYFNLDNSIGLSNILTGDMEAEVTLELIREGKENPSDEEVFSRAVDRVMFKTEYPGLLVVPCGPIPLNSIELIKGERFGRFIKNVREKADITLFDSPPAIHVVDPLVIGNQVDGVLWVISSGAISREDAQNVKKMLESGKGKLLGVTLNNITKESREYYFHYYYYAQR